MKRRTILMAAILMGVFAQGIAFAAGNADQPEKAAGPVTLRFSWWGNDARHNATLAAIDLFMKANPNIKIEAEYGGWDGYYTKLATMVAGGSAPDIMQTDVKFMPDIIAQGDVFYDLGSFKDKIDTSGFDKKFVDNWGVFNGKLVGLPLGINGQTAIMNVSLMKKAGIPENTVWSWNKIKEEGMKLRSVDPNVYMLLLDPFQVSEHIMWPWLSQLSGKQNFNSKEFTKNFTEAEAKMILTYVKDLLDTGVLVPFTQSSVFNVNQTENPLWTGGKVALYLNYTTHVVNAMHNAPGVEVAVGRFPVAENAKHTSIGVQPSQLLTINAKSAHPAEAAAFVDFLFNNEGSIRALKLERSVPAVSKARELLGAANMLDPTLSRAVNIALQHGGQVRTADLQWNAEITQIVLEAVETVGYGKTAPETAAATMIRKIDTKLMELKAAVK